MTNSRASATVIVRNGNYIVTQRYGRRKSVFEVTPGGVISDKSGEPVLSSDVVVVKSAFILNGLSEMAGRVQRWWDGR